MSKSDDKPTLPELDLVESKREFIETFFKRGAEFTEELVAENERLRGRLAALETENTKLRTQLAKDTSDAQFHIPGRPNAGDIWIGNAS